MWDMKVRNKTFPLISGQLQYTMLFQQLPQPKERVVTRDDWMKIIRQWLAG